MESAAARWRPQRLLLVAAPAGRAVDLVRASQWIKRRNAPSAKMPPRARKVLNLKQEKFCNLVAAAWRS
jgi:hypothetical protein